MKSLQNKLNLIKEGKGNKELFLKEARAMFPNVVTGALTFDQAVHNLTERGILSEGFIGVSSKRPNNPDWFQIFNENVKAELKDTDKDVEKLETAGYDYKDEKNSNNLSMESILTGYYAEMKDPKNAEKTEQQLKELVVKNLEKDPMHYVKDGQFGVKGLGYTDKHPGLGATKEVTGKYKSSGMEPVKLNEDKDRDKIAKYEKYTYTLDGKKVKPDDIDFYGHILGIEIDGEVYRPGIPDEKGNIELKPRKGKTGMYTESKHSAEADLKIYKSELNMLNKIKPTGEKQLKRKAELEKKIADLESKMNEIGMFHDPVGYKKSEPNPKDLIFTKKFVGTSDTPGHSGYIYDIYKNGVKIKTIEGEGNANAYINQLQRDLEEGVNEYLGGTMDVPRNYGMDFDDDEEDYEGDENQDYYDEDGNLIPLRSPLHPNNRNMEEGREKLKEGANKAMEKAVKEIEKKSELAKAEAKVSQIDELISELESKLSMTEAEGVSDMVDKKKVKEIQRNIKFLEAKKKRYDKEKSRLEGKYGEKKKEIMDEVEEPKKMSYGEAVKEMLKAKGLKK